MDVAGSIGRGLHDDRVDEPDEWRVGNPIVDLEIEGHLANALPRWGGDVVGRHVWTEVRDADEIPYVSASEDPLVTSLLTDEWAHDEVLPHLPV